jgi:SNF2 family DNA or RNA helicase
VERFQNYPNFRLFLSRLKVGGLGLNLTAADYVFILDPWWNSAAEAQAVDYAHRIGKAGQVFSYRLIARETVEEKVFQLKETRRNLADAILGTSSRLIRDLRPKDIKLLFSRRMTSILKTRTNPPILTSILRPMKTSWSARAKQRCLHITTQRRGF